MTSPTSGVTYSLFVGIDIAATTASVAWISTGNKVTRALSIDQSPQGFSILDQRLLSTGHSAASTLLVMEATGSYWITLATHLRKQDLPSASSIPLKRITLPRHCSNGPRPMPLMRKRLHSLLLRFNQRCGVRLPRCTRNFLSV